MTSPRKFSPFSWHVAVIMVAFACGADGSPQLKDLSFEWHDTFTVALSWKPSLSNEGVKFRISKSERCTNETTINELFLTEEVNSDHWTYNITIVDKDCKVLSDNTSASITIHTPKPRAILVTDFKCLLYTNGMNCSWHPVSQSLDLTLHYRICGDTEKHKNNNKNLKKCDEPFRSEKTDGCFLPVNKNQDDVCIFVETKDGMSSFKAPLVVPSPKLSIKEEGDNLVLNLMHTELGHCRFTYEVCYKHCNEPKQCWNKSEPTMEVFYKKSCLYEFRARVLTTDNCPKIFSDFSKVEAYGTNKPPDRTLTVVAIVIPIILSLCVILSCYCVRRHSAIICPVVPDPSAIFKEMMMNGNKEPKTTERSLYTPVPEPIEPCKITPVTKNSVILQLP